MLEVTNKEYGNFTKALAKAATDPSWRLAPLVDRLGGGGGGGGVPAALPPCPPAYDSNHNDAIYQGHRKEVAVVVPLVGPVDQLPGKMADQSQRRPSEFAKLLILMKRSNIQLYRDWVSHWWGRIGILPKPAVRIFTRTFPPFPRFGGFACRR